MDNGSIVRHRNAQGDLRHNMNHLGYSHIKHDLLKRLGHVLHDEANSLVRQVINYYRQQAYNVPVLQKLEMQI